MPHKIHLSADEDLALLALSQNSTVPSRVRQRAEALRLSARDWTVPRIAEFFHCHQQTIRETFQRWWDGGIEGLYEAPGRGGKSRCTQEDLACLEKRILEDEQTYNARQLSELLLAERGVSMSAVPLRRALKKMATSGNAHAKVLVERIQSSGRRGKNSSTSSKRRQKMVSSD
ncbi:helix-turn-helix domain-containing protein [Gloeobacter morelensis]|uniref:Helix-turn-helix domain-containing protein n=1 Tax=Gloeobacter morelensis MG652769 TaxID=2781736 RepID=A0ABY3PI27_9CYAN|nr:helix-turn-helix domain-containing protein [Gloeobacter morelensis]UFP92623.1 helix-turn-helix domain-containing protein [Gloeobacter morelensis MG652769]UFP93316.1 helix-turn-helix domain-containing protein [Gloeobacter morelensis MG652769]UFP93957.1 helix-turn-helix domain-containing protein [Gloeobacter morelensis MG652769]UFP94351.1 helix-turn-helix domain-containing protein [Gloeobacter morelensis MG652769]UFP95070.1 helix-turn-helix domain-containing protein [Gloeobacter morelensis MG